MKETRIRSPRSSFILRPHPYTTMLDELLQRVPVFVLVVFRLAG
jgi:hypothetical protein